MLRWQISEAVYLWGAGNQTGHQPADLLPTMITVASTDGNSAGSRTSGKDPCKVFWQSHSPSIMAVTQEGYTAHVRTPSSLHGPDGLAPSFERQSCDSGHANGDPAEHFFHPRFTGETDGAHCRPPGDQHLG